MAKKRRAPATEDGSSRLDRVFAGIERVGNKIPHPFILFGYLLALLAIVSTVLAAFHVTVRVPGEDEATPVLGVLTVDGIVWWLEHFVENFISFPPLGNVLVMLIAVGVAERTGFLASVVTASFARAPRFLLPYAVAFVACQGHVMSDPSMIVIPPLAALVFRAAGRHPVAGLLGAFACTASGYAGGIVIGSLDALLQGITAKVATIVPAGEGLATNVTMNWYFAAASGLILPLVGGFCIDRILEPRLGEWTDPHDADVSSGLTAQQRRGLAWAMSALLVYVVAVFAIWLTPGSFLRGEGDALVPSPFLDGLIPLLVLAFLIPGLVYGLVTRSIRRARDVPTMMAAAVKDMSGYIVFIFAASQFIALFTWTNLGTLIAVEAAEALRSAHLTGFFGVLGMVVIATLANLFITSGSALWSLLAPVMVPAFMLLGFHPAFIQAAYRIGDSATQGVTPLNAYVYVVLDYTRKYQPGTQLGTVLARLSIFVVPFWVTWVAILAVFYVFDLPVGPGAPIRLP